ncbi:MAG: pitrilysin family protein [bacterium]|nr:pitrilysin family protein [bacterium]
MHNPEKPMKLFTYPNGLRLITTPLDSTKTVTVLVLVGTGSRYETKEINGISHFLEHMMFKGTTKRPGALDISQELDSIGADYNAFTSKEYTGYYIKASSDKLDLALDLISDIFQNSRFDAIEIEKEKGVIIEEINMYLDQPSRHVHDLFDELLYGNQPMGWNIAGEKEIIKKLTRDNIADYFNTHYFAENTVVSVGGSINPEEVKERVAKYFNGIRQHTKLNSKSTDDSQSKPGLKIFNKKTDQTHFKLGVRAYDMFSHKLEALDLISVILGGNMSSRLFVEVREKRGLAYRIRTSADAFLDVGSLDTYAGIDNARFTEALKIILTEYKKLAEEQVPEKELQKAKDYIRGTTLIGLESSDDVAMFYGDQELLKNKMETPEEKLAKIDTVTAEDIQKVSREIFTPNKLNLAIIGEVDNKEEELREILNSW